MQVRLTSKPASIVQSRTTDIESTATDFSYSGFFKLNVIVKYRFITT